MATKNVIDVSHFNGSIDWAKVKGNVDAVIIRAGYRGYGSAGTLATDQKFHENIKGAIAQKIPFGVYWCSQALSDTEALAEAAYLNNLLEGYKLTYPVYLDSETMGPGATGRADKIGKQRRTQYGLTFCRAMKDYGFKVGLYCSESWYTAEIDGAKFAAAGFSIWIAKYSSTKPSMSCDAWQYTSAGKVQGISGNVDLSDFYKDYSKEDNGMKFEDVDEKSFCYDAVNWAADAGIASGTDKTNFSPDAPCTRGQVITFLYRFAKWLGKA